MQRSASRSRPLAKPVRTWKVTRRLREARGYSEAYGKLLHHSARKVLAASGFELPDEPRPIPIDPAVVVVGTVVNSSHEHISVQTFITDLERELTNSQKVTFVAGKGERDELRTERKEQAMYSREDTQKAPGKEIGADYMMKGTISTILDEAEGTKAVFYQVDLQMVDLESNAKVWYGQKKIKKVIEKKRTIF